MARQPREKSATGIYHVMMRGVNREVFFQDDSDKLIFMQILNNVALVCPFKLLAFCLMSTHVHLLIQEENSNLSEIMRRVGTRYARYYNAKYERIGHLCQDRYKSEKVETVAYLLTVVRYIHQNPIKAKMVTSLDYPWSSHNAYLGYSSKLFRVDTETVLLNFAENRTGALELYKSFMSIIDNDTRCLEYEDVLTDELLEQEIMKLLNGQTIADMHKMRIPERNLILRQAKEIHGASIRQISRVTGFGRYIIANAR